MRLGIAILLGGLTVGFAPPLSAQPAGGKDRSRGKDSASKTAESAADRAALAKMFAFDKDGDGKLARSEITDHRLLPLFDRADVNQDGIVTKEELLALFAKEKPTTGGFGAHGFDGFPGGGPGGPGGPIGPGGPRPRPGQVLPGGLQEMLELTDAQKKQLKELQTDVDSRLDKILTDEQKSKLKSLADRGPPPPSR